MRLPINKTYSSQVALLTIACFLHALVGCERAPASGTVFIRVTDPAGQITEKSFTHEEFATSAKASVDQLIAPDEESIDPARILSEGSVSLKLASGKVLELTTEGNRVALANGPVAAALSWNADRTELTIDAPTGNSKVELTGAHDPEEVARFVGNTAIGLFAVLADPTLAASMATGERPYCGPCVIFVILIIGWLACITGGTWLCTQQARFICSRGVRNVWVDCGISYRNGWQFGFGCTIECW
ncbi:MAG: hypothetical protein E6J63_05270 [Deltaproteobacteria bacterium]|nr:MAG: hypothetical protein E6J63_05270 [Deltaproteobacteria bacterium]